MVSRCSLGYRVSSTSESGRIGLKSQLAKGAILSEPRPCGKWRYRLKIRLSRNPDQKVFTAHGPGYVTVSGERHERPIVVVPQQVFGDWPATTFATLEEVHFEYFLALQPEVLLFGTGAEHRFAHPRLYRALSNAGIGVEFMTTPAACRTYNILMDEGRKVVVAILFE